MKWGGALTLRKPACQQPERSTKPPVVADYRPTAAMLIGATCAALLRDHGLMEVFAARRCYIRQMPFVNPLQGRPMVQIKRLRGAPARRSNVE